LTDTPASRLGEQTANFALRVVGASARPAIGTPDVIANAPAPQIRAFYRRFYRPERATLVVVGDVEPANFAGLIADHFKNWQSPAESTVDDVTPKSIGAVTTTHIEEHSRTHFNFAHTYWVGPFKISNTEAELRKNLMLQVGTSSINRRYSEIEQSKTPPFISADLNVTQWPGLADVAMMGVDFQEGRWRESLIKADAIRRDAMNSGVTQSEVAAQTAGILERYRRAVELSATAVSALIADALVRDLNEGRVSQGPLLRQQLAQNTLAGLRASAVNAALKCESDTIWAFTPSGHPAHPSAVKQSVVSRDGST
jgi:zinc protease